MAVIRRGTKKLDVATKILTPDLGSISLHNYAIIHTIDFCFMCFLYFCYIKKKLIYKQAVPMSHPWWSRQYVAAVPTLRGMVNPNMTHQSPESVTLLQIVGLLYCLCNGCDVVFPLQAVQ